MRSAALADRHDLPFNHRHIDLNKRIQKRVRTSASPADFNHEVSVSHCAGEIGDQQMKSCNGVE